MKPIIKLLLAFIALVILLGVSLAATSQPNFCQSCHEMKNDYQAWQKSSHKQVNCTACHIESGAVNFVKHKLASLKEVAAHVSNNYETPINKASGLSSELPSENCLSCHKSPGKESNESLIFDHTKHKDLDFNCAHCHNRVAHPDMEDYKNRVTMALCVDCHKEKNASLECKTCHPGGFELKPASHSKGDWLKAHGKNDISSCSDCHFDTERFCTDCHGLSMPHPGGWMGTHGKNPNLLSKCDKCHDRQDYCTKCHD